jgi:two-component system, OmpR family, sensor kinase
MTETMTTEAPPGDPGAAPAHTREPRLAGVSVRTRLTAAVALLTGLALAAAGLLVFSLESVRIDNAVNDRADQEIAEFTELQRGGDPTTGRPFTTVEALVDLYLRRNVPAESEALIGYWEGAPRLGSESPHPELVKLPAFLALVDRRLDTGGAERLDTPYGEVLVNVAPVRGSTTTGALVIASFLSGEHAELNRVVRTYVVISVLLLGLITAGAWWQAGRLLSPLRTLRDAARDISESDLSRRIPERGNDDITALTRTVNQMLSRLELAFAGQRQFLDDAGHELKTPLTVLRGHLELVDPQDRAEVVATRDLLLDEIDRMSRLVADLTTLAKTDRPDFVQPAPVDVDALLRGVLEKCRALGPRAWRLDETAGVTADLDDQRVTQALLQLAQNAVRHTRPGEQVAVGARMVDGAAGSPVPDTGGADRLELWVRDTGPGVPDTDKDRIFDRFVRGADAATDDGFGLGLSIVSAIARAHGGSVRVEDAPGGGARFVLSLPQDRTNARPAPTRQTTPRRKDHPWPAS